MNRVLESLKKQTLPQQEWELLFIDNNSKVALKNNYDISWHSNSRHILEERQGLVYGRVRMATEAAGEIIVTVDDDTPLEKEYLFHIKRIFQTDLELGIIGGKTLPIFETTPPIWLSQFYGCLAIRDLGNNVIETQLKKGEKATTYPTNGPLLIALKKNAMQSFLNRIDKDVRSLSLGRKGTSLASGEDNDIVLTIYEAGYKIGYFPELKFYHIIPAQRMTKEYICRLHFSINKSWVLMLSLHNLCPWKVIPKWSVSIRKLKAFFTYKAWKKNVNYIKWRGACGTFEGLAK